jgi:hypothetical protein
MDGEDVGPNLVYRGMFYGMAITVGMILLAFTICIVSDLAFQALANHQTVLTQSPGTDAGPLEGSAR